MRLIASVLTVVGAIALVLWFTPLPMAIPLVAGVATLALFAAIGRGPDDNRP